jgi:hypothetical protein
VAFVDKHNNANVLAFASRKCRRVTRSVLASELFALVAGSDVAASIAAQVSEILGMQIPVWNAIDSGTLFNIVTRMGTLTEKRVMVDAAELREQHLQRKMLFFWIPSGEDADDPFTKVTGDFRAPDGLLSGKLSLRPNAWVEHNRERRSEEDDKVLPLQ